MRVLGVVLLLCVVGVAVLTRPGVLRPLAERVLSGAIGGRVVVSSARWDWPMGVELSGLEVSGGGGSDAVGLRVARVEASLGWGGVRSVVVEKPGVVLRDDGRGGVELMGMSWWTQQKRGVGGGSGGAEMPERGRLVDAELVIERPMQQRGAASAGAVDGVAAEQWEVVERLVLNGEWGMDSSGARWEVSGSALEAERPDAEAAVLTGWVDRETGETDMRVEHVALGSPHRAVAPRALRELWDRLEPQGRFPVVHVRLKREASSGHLEVAAAEVELREVSVTLPLNGLGDAEDADDDGDGDVDAESADRAEGVRMESVEGRLALVGERLEITSLSGLIEGLRYRVDGWQELRLDGRGEVSLETEPFELREEPPWILRLPRVARQAHEQLRPSGRYSASVLVRRAERDGPWAIAGELRLIDAALQLKAFPYALSNVRGRITFDERSVSLEALSAEGPTGGRLGVNGLISEPAGEVVVDVRVDLVHVPIDDALIDAMAPKARDLVRGLFDRVAFAHVESLVKQSTDTDPTHAFEVGGEANGQVHITLDPSMHGHAWVQTTIDAAGLGIVMQEFPYPMRGESGRVVINENAVTMEEVQLVGPSGGRGVLTGKVDRKAQGGVLPMLVIESVDAPLDAWLRAAMPERDARWLEMLGLRGRMTGRATVGRGSMPGKMGYTLAVVLNDGVLRPFDGAFELNGMGGSAWVEPGLVRLENMTARRGEGTLSVTGEVRMDRATGDTSINLSGQGSDLEIDRAWAGLFPVESPMRERLTALFERFEPRGRVGVRFDAIGDVEPASQQPPQENANDSSIVKHTPMRVSLTVEPKRLSATHHGQRFDLRDMTGSVSVRADHLKLSALRGVMADGWAEVDGVLATDSSSDTALTLRAESVLRCPVTRALLPTAATAALDAIEAAGRYTLTDGRLLVRAAQDGADAQPLELDAAVELSGVSARAGVAIEQLTGELSVGVRSEGTGALPALTLQLRSPSLRVSGRVVDGLEVVSDNAGQRDWLEVRSLRGRVYGGALSGVGGVRMGQPGRFKLDLVLQEAALGPIIDAGAEPGVVVEQELKPVGPATGEGMADRSTQTGLVSASLALEADPADVGTRMGRGEVTFRDASLFDRPLASAVLRSVNFALPTTRPLDNGRAKFSIEGQSVRFEELRLSGPGLSFVGTGAMQMPQTTLNLALFTRNQAAPNLGPLSQLIDAFKDELIGIHVTGTLGEPIAQLSTLNGLRRVVSELLRQTPTPIDRDTPAAETIEPTTVKP